MKIVVTGALGHIGSKLIRSLPYSFSNAEMLLIDNFSTQRYSSLFKLPKYGRYQFLDGDIRNINLKDLIREGNIVIHLAAITDAESSVANKKLVEDHNFNSTRLVCDACSAVGASLIHLSSTSVYGTSSKKVSEDCSPNELRPQSPYAETKLREEFYVIEACRELGLRAVSLRFGTIFGISPGMRFHTAINKFCWQASWGMPLSIWKTAYHQVRPYLEITDACNAITHVIKNNLFDGHIFNVLTLNSPVEAIVEEIRAFAPRLVVNFVESAIMNQLSYDVLNEKFKDTGFEFSGSLGSGIKDTMNLLSPD